MTPLEIAQAIVAREGGWANDVDDPGGPTKYGVTLRTLKGLGIDLDGDGDSDVDDLKLLTVPQATEIFLDHYYRKPRIDELAARYPNRGVRLRACAFDMQVNSGANAVKILQRLCARCGVPAGAADGAIGAKTLAAVAELADRSIGDLASAYAIARVHWYFRLGDRRRRSRKYCRTGSGHKGGWIRRAEEFLPAALHMTGAEFQQRVAGWA